MRRISVVFLLILFLFAFAGRVTAQSPTPLPATPTPRPLPTSTLTPQPSPTPPPTPPVVVVLFATPIAQEAQSTDFTRDVLPWIQCAVDVVGFLLVVVGLVLTYLKLDQSFHHRAIELSNERNWQHLLHPDEFPTALPYWKDLTSAERKWRVFLLNHLNLLYLVYEDHNKKVVGRAAYENWKRKTTWMLGEICRDESRDARKAQTVLRQLLRHEEGHWSPKFRAWLKEGGVIASDFFPAAGGEDDGTEQAAEGGGGEGVGRIGAEDREDGSRD